MSLLVLEKLKKTVVVMLLACGAASCATQDVYEAFQSSEQRDCTNLPPSQYNECVNQTSKSYEDYQRERKILIGEDKY